MIVFRALFLSLIALLLARPLVRADTAIVTTLAGSTAGGNPTDGPGTTARLSAYNLAVDSMGNVVFADWAGRSIRKLSPDGVVSTIAGGQNNGIPSPPSRVDGPLATATFVRPMFVAIDNAGTLYVYDAGAIRRITPDGNVTTLALSQTASNGGSTSATPFTSVTGMAADRDGNLYLIDGPELRKVRPDGNVSGVAARTPISGSPFAITGVATTSSGDVLIADSDGATIRRLAPDGTLTVIAGQIGTHDIVDGSGTSARFSSPAAIAVDAAGYAWVMDGSVLAGSVLRRVAPDGVTTTLAGSVDPADVPLDGTGGAARFGDALALAAGSSGPVYLADGGRYANGATLIRGIAFSGTAGTPVLTKSPATLTHQVLAGAGDPVAFTAAAIGQAPIAYQWFHNGAAIAGATTATLSLTGVASADAGDYLVRASNIAGATTSRAESLKVFTPGVRDFIARRVVTGGGALRAIVAGAGQLAAVGDGGLILTSIDGTNWIRRQAPRSTTLRAVAYGGGLFVAVGDAGLVLVSPDGASWSVATTPSSAQPLNGVAFGAGRWVAVGGGGSIMSSADAQTWRIETSGVSGSLNAITYVPFVPFTGSGDTGTGRFYVAGSSGTMLSNPSTAWTREPVGATTDDLDALANGPIAFGTNGRIVYTQVYTTAANPPDSVQPIYSYSYRSGTMKWSIHFRAATLGPGATYAVGDSGTIVAVQSGPGASSQIASGTTATLRGAAFRENTLFVVGDDQTILQSESWPGSRMINVAARGRVSGDAAPLIGGFVINGATSKQVLVRAAGPSLANFGVTAPLSRPILTLFDSAGAVVSRNGGWRNAPNPDELAATATRTGAFPFPVQSADAAILLTLSPGAYTAVVSSADGNSGVALAEVYDTDPSVGESRAVNLSGRADVGGGENVLIAGFVIAGPTPRRVLLRAIGPALRAFGIASPLGQPRLQLYNAAGLPVVATLGSATLTDVDAVAAASALAGAFTVPANGGDVGMVITLDPGNYTAQLSGID
jgi:hypothetical protein